MSENPKAAHYKRLAAYAKNSAPVEAPLLITPGKTVELFSASRPLTPQEKRHLGEDYQLP